ERVDSLAGGYAEVLKACFRNDRLALCSLAFTLFKKVIIMPPQHSIRSIGMGGGGALSAPSISPQLIGNMPRWLFLACDLYALYRSTDGGQNWDFINQRLMRSEQLMTNVQGAQIPGCRVAFD